MDKLITQGVAKAMRKDLFTNPDIAYINDDFLLRLFLDELNDRNDVKTGMSRLRCGEYLWYLTYEGRLGMVKKGGMKSNAEHLLREKLIVKDRYGIYRGTRIINGRGCQCPKHRPIIDALSRGRWSPFIVNKLSDLLDGGHELEMVIDTDFESAYSPDYDSGAHNIEDLVTSQSCMSCRGDEAQEFYGGIEGCKVARFLKDGEDVGRCIVYEYNGIRHFIRIYCQDEYQRDCLYTLKHNMREGDLFGRCEYIHGMELPTSWDSDTPNMYLDGNEYGVFVRDGKLWVGVDYEWDCKSTSDGCISDEWENICYCANCGEIMSMNDDYICDKDDGRYYCCESCAEEAGLSQCEECGEWTSDVVETEDGHYFCSSYCAKENGYVYTDSHRWVDENDVLEIDGYRYVDEEDAIDSGWKKCDECGCWTRVQYTCDDGKTRCHSCLNNGEWELKYVKQGVKDDQAETDETSGD